jgi:hypothetical protein
LRSSVFGNGHAARAMQQLNFAATGEPHADCLS